MSYRERGINRGSFGHRYLGVCKIFVILYGVSVPLEPALPYSGPDRPNPVSKWRRAASTFLMIVGLIVIGYPTLTEAYGYFVQYRLNEDWNKELSRQEQLAAVAETKQIDQYGNKVVDSEDTILGRAVSSVKAEKSAEFPTTKIKIPKIGVDQVVLDDVDSETLKKGPGHYRGTANPGQRGTVGIAGHRVTYTHPFNRLDELKRGDTVLLETLENIYEYRVIKSNTLEPDDLSALVPAKDGLARLALTTCAPKYSARFRLDVQASLVRVTPRNKPTIFRKLVKNIAPPVSDEIPQNILDLAVEQAQEAVAVNPASPGARIRLGIVYRNVGRYDDAVAQLDQAIALDGDNAAAYFQLASVYVKTGSNAKAIDALRRAIELDPNLESAYYRLGDIYLELDRPNEAVDAFSRALSINSLSGDTHYRLGRSYEALGKDSLARESYKKAVKYVPDFLEAKAALRRLEREEGPN